MKEAGTTKLPTAKRVVLVGNKISPGNPVNEPDGTVVRTLWGELAWQLGGKKAYLRIKADDERATNPRDVLSVLFGEYGPCSPSAWGLSRSAGVALRRSTSTPWRNMA